MRIKKTNTILITRIFLLLAIFFFSVSAVNAQQHMPPPGGQHMGGQHHDPNMPPPGGQHMGGQHHDPNMPPSGSATDGPLHPCPPACDNQQHGGPGTMPPGTTPSGAMAPKKVPGGVFPGTTASGTMPLKKVPGGVFPGTTADGSDSSGSADCSQTPEDGWQSVTEVRSETDYQIGFDDSVAGRQFSKFDNDSSIVCVAGAVKPVYVGATPSDSNLGAYISSGMACELRNDNLSSGGRGVDKLICP